MVLLIWIVLVVVVAEQDIMTDGYGDRTLEHAMGQVNDMGTEPSPTMMDLVMKDHGSTIKSLAKVFSFTAVVLNWMDTGGMIRFMEAGRIIIRMDALIYEIIEMVIVLVKVCNFHQTDGRHIC